MSIAQGVSRVEWFEAQEGGYSMGLLDSSGAPRPAYAALKNLTAELGRNPHYEGWLLLNNKDYGFVVEGVKASVMAIWAPPATEDNIDFGTRFSIMDPLDGRRVETTECLIRNAPVLVIGIRPGLVTQAKQNRSRPFPWGGDYSSASSVSIVMDKPEIAKGLHLLNPEALPEVTVDGVTARDCSKIPGIAFAVDPNFLSYTHTPIQIRAIVRKISAADHPGFNLKYESAAGRKGIGWNSVPGADKWHTLTWNIADDEFVGSWAYHFSFDSDSTNNSRYYLREVTVTKLVPEAAAEPQ